MFSKFHLVSSFVKLYEYLEKIICCWTVSLHNDHRKTSALRFQETFMLILKSDRVFLIKICFSNNLQHGRLPFLWLACEHKPL